MTADQDGGYPQKLSEPPCMLGQRPHSRQTQPLDHQSRECIFTKNDKNAQMVMIERESPPHR